MIVRRVGLGVLAAAFLLAAVAPSWAAKADWKKEWDQTVAAANKEGALTISGPSGTVWRNALMTFEKDYPGIKLKITAFSGRDFWPRFIKEREVGQYLWDLRLGGTDYFAYKLKSEGQFASVRNLLLLPEVADDDNWYGGIDGLFLDNEKRYILAYVAVETSPARYNRKFVPVPSLDVKDLVDLKWKGKIAMADPHIGSSLAGMAILYKRYGPDFIKKLAIDQDPVITRIPRQQFDWMNSGRYPISWGLPSSTLAEYAHRGGDTSIFVNVNGGLQWSNGVGAILMPTKAPHPAAAKVFVNWLLTKSTQTALMKAVQLNSRHKGVPPGAPDLALDHSKIGDYENGQAEGIRPYQNKVIELLKEYGK